MSATDQIVGILPTVVVAGVATKMTQSMFSNPAAVSRSKKKNKARKGYPSTWNRPW